MRLIDVDALPNYKLIGTMALGSERSPAELRIVLWEDIKSMPTIDAVPVVRCKNCKHFNLQTHECENELLSTDHEGGASYSLNFYDDDFCSYGEWREADHEVSEL